MVEVATGGIGTRAVAKRYPATEGLTAGTTKRYKDSPYLKPQGIHGVKSTARQY